MQIKQINQLKNEIENILSDNKAVEITSYSRPENLVHDTSSTLLFIFLLEEYFLFVHWSSSDQSTPVLLTPEPSWDSPSVSWPSAWTSALEHGFLLPQRSLTSLWLKRWSHKQGNYLDRMMIHLGTICLRFQGKCQTHICSWYCQHFIGTTCKVLYAFIVSLIS